MMNPRIGITIIIFAVMAGAVAIFLSNRLMRRYARSYLSSYFYFLIFSYIFSTYSIIGSQVIQFLLSDHNVNNETINSASSILMVLGIPFLILAMFMFLRLTKEFFLAQLSKLITLIYFIAILLLFSAYLFFNVYDGTIGTVSFHPEIPELKILFSILHLVVFGYGLSYLYIKSGSIIDINQRRAVRWFARWYILIYLLVIGSLNLHSVHWFFGLFFILGYMGFHLIPLLFLQVYLQKHYVENVEEGGFDDKLGIISEKFGISKREKEVIILICKGMTNQEISDSLFISVQTVKDHIHRVFIKTGVKNRVQLTNLLGKQA